MKSPGRASGRPPKFSEPSRPITVTLPESILQGLESIDKDRAQAIVKVATAAFAAASEPVPKVEIVEMASNTGLIVVGPSEALRRIDFLHLVEVAPRRFLLALQPGHDFRALELALQDVLDEVCDGDPEGSVLISELLDKIRQVRKAERISMAEILLVKLNTGRAGANAYRLLQCWFAALCCGAA